MSVRGVAGSTGAGGLTTESWGSSMIGRYMGQDSMNMRAKLYAQTDVRLVSNGAGKGDAASPARRKESWRASTVNIDAASVKSILLSMKPNAPPKYAPIPTEVIMFASSTNSLYVKSVFAQINPRLQAYLRIRIRKRISTIRNRRNTIRFQNLRQSSSMCTLLHRSQSHTISKSRLESVLLVLLIGEILITSRVEIIL